MTTDAPVDTSDLKAQFSLNYREGEFDALFKLGHWEIHAMIENPEVCEIFHWCQRDTDGDDPVHWSYQLPGDEECPGCGAVQPDEIQGLVAMYNMDHPVDEMYGRSVGIDLIQWEKMWNKVFFEQMKAVNHMMNWDSE